MKWMVFTMIGAGAGLLGAAVVWPWLGPMLVVPCPVATTAGCWVAAIGGGLQGLAAGLK